MLKGLFTLLSLALVNFSLVFGSIPGPTAGMPPRQDKLDAHSAYAKGQLRRAEQLLKTLITDSYNYQLILSSNPNFGAEAFPAGVFADKPTLIIYQGSLGYNHSNEELAFMLAHEVGHVRLDHFSQMDRIMEKLQSGHPAGYIGLTMIAYFQKFKEQEADMFGLYLYKKSGYNPQFFNYQLNVIRNAENYQQRMGRGMMPGMGVEPGSLSLKDPHFCMRERFEHLVKHANDSPYEIASWLGIPAYYN